MARVTLRPNALTTLDALKTVMGTAAFTPFTGL